MGTHISVFLTHTLPSWRDATDTLTRLRGTEPSCCEVAEYWRTSQGYENDATQWATYEALEDSILYTGPGSLSLEVTPLAARIHTGGRWRGFLSIEPLRRVHLAAFHSIAEALCSDTMALSHDSTWHAHELFGSGAKQSECIDALRAALGPPQSSIDAIDPLIVTMTERTVPDVWYLERVSRLGFVPTG